MENLGWLGCPGMWSFPQVNLLIHEVQLAAVEKFVYLSLLTQGSKVPLDPWRTLRPDRTEFYRHCLSLHDHMFVQT